MQLSGIQVTQAITAWGTLLIAVMGAYIAYQQFKLGRERHKLDLYDRRMAVFDGVNRLVTATMIYENEFPRDELFLFNSAVSQAQFLFGPEIKNWLDEVRQRAWRMSSLDARERAASEDTKAKYTAELRKLHNWFWENKEAHHLLFKPYLQFAKLHGGKSFMGRLVGRVKC